MTMYRRILAVVGAVLLVVAVGGFLLLKTSPMGPSSRADRAQVTGYASSDVSGRTSGAVSVDLDGASAARIDTIVEGLPRANLQYLCAENAQEYHITFSADAGKGVRRGFALTGYWCNNLVVEVPLHGLAVARVDRDCSLLAAVRRLLPASAIATHSGTCAHANGRLFLAVAKHRTAVHATPKPKTLKHRTLQHPVGRRPAPRHWTLRHQTPKRGAPVRERLRRETL